VEIELIQCAVCQQMMEIITWKHLQKHGLTTAEYKNKFPEHPIRSPSAIHRKHLASIKANNSRRGVHRSDETKAKIKKTKSLNPKAAWNKGIPKSQDEKDRLSLIKKQQYASGEYIHWNTGNHWSDEVKTKIRQTALNQHRQYSPISSEKRTLTYTKKKQNGWTHPSTVYLLSKISPENFALLNDSGWLYDQHITNQRTLASICVELGLHWKNSQVTLKSKLKSFNIPIRHWHQASSNQQRDVEDFITSLGFSIVTRNRTLIAPLELDIFIPSKKIAIEYCGLYWHTTQHKDPNYHKIKYDRCMKIGIRLITIYSDEWLNNECLVKQKIKNI